jgi:hypothetical protein
MAGAEGIESRVTSYRGDLEGTSLSVAGETTGPVANSQELNYTCLNVNHGLVYVNRALRLSLWSVHRRILIFGEAILWLKRNRFCRSEFLLVVHRILPTIHVDNSAKAERACFYEK